MTHRPPTQGELDGVQIGDGTPHLGDQTLLRHVDVAEVEGVVDGLHLPHLDEPHPDGLGCSLQDPLPVVLGLVQDLWETNKLERVTSGDLVTILDKTLRTQILRI